MFHCIQTKQNRDAQQQLKKKRKAMMAARLAKVRQRKLIREGKDPSEITDLLESLGSYEDNVCFILVVLSQNLYSALFMIKICMKLIFDKVRLWLYKWFIDGLLA